MAFGLQPHIRSWPKSAATGCKASKPLEASHHQKLEPRDGRPEVAGNTSSSLNPLQIHIKSTSNPSIHQHQANLTSRPRGKSFFGTKSANPWTIWALDRPHRFSKPRQASSSQKNVSKRFKRFLEPKEAKFIASRDADPSKPSLPDVSDENGQNFASKPPPTPIQS